MQKTNKQMLLLIRFLPFIFILISSISIYTFIEYENSKHFEKDREFTKTNYITEEKKRIKSNIKRLNAYLTDFEKEGQSLLKSKLKREVLNAYNIMEHIYNKNKEIKTKEEITALIKQSLQNIRFNGGRGYYFIYDMEGKNIFHPLKPSREGKSFIDEQDSNNEYFQRNRIKLLEENKEVYFKYFFERPNEKGKKSMKMSFLKVFEPFNWYIGSGEYLKDYTASLKEEALSFIHKLEYKDNGYVFVINNNKIIANKNRNFEGIDISTDPDLEKFFNEYKKLKKEKDGVFIQYLIPNEEENIQKNKVSFIMEFKKWNWVIGTGFDLDNLEYIVKTRQEEVNKESKNYTSNLLFFGIIIISILLWISYLLSKYMENIILKYQKELEEKNKILSTAQEIAKIADWEVDLNTMEINLSSTSRVLGVGNQSLEKGESFLKKILYKEDWDCLERSIKDRKKISCLFTLEQEDGSTSWIDCKGSYVKIENKIIGTFQDITELKKTEKEKQEKEKLLYQQSKMAALGEMLANISHQWKQPLSTISTVSTGVKLQKELGVLDDKQFSEGMDTINETTQHLSNTIDDFKNFFKPSSGISEKADISNSINRALRLVKSGFDLEDIKIIKNIENIEFIFLENELIQVLLNILNNGRDALIESKNKNKLIFINLFKKDEKVFIEIYDNANGIDKNIIKKIFEQYFTTKDSDNGTGIGLYMSQNIITNLMKGSIYVDNHSYVYNSIEYTGARFTISLDLNLYK